ncbi:MAG: CRISPR-associated endonuclease Cas3'', partial [Myxococcales bacterium]|nr:CRISPR-associated endonuclease Cas3'' [Myxococcales bacterium]
MEDGTPHLLDEHLTEVGSLASSFLEGTDWKEFGRIAGLWHDLGKYSLGFQRRIREENGFAAHMEGATETFRDHSTAGALWAQEKLGKNALPIAMAIAAHHAGLADLDDLKRRLRERGKTLEEALSGSPVSSILEDYPRQVPAALAHISKEPKALLRLELSIRILFSALCDADFLDTERFYDATRAALRDGRPPLNAIHDRLLKHIESLQAHSDDSPVNRARADVQQHASNAAALSPGVFDLTVPTGGGKTLAGLRFGVEHALKHEFDRVIVAIPFTSIIEQTSDVYRAILGEEAVIEHHSALDPLRENPRNRIACENWDGPVVVTTTVQLFESLFARRTSRARKLHRVRKSVIILDEAQTLPPCLLRPILGMLNGLVEDHQVSVVICTATQPALGRSSWLPEGFEEIR